MKEASLPLQTSPTLRELPPSPRPLRSENSVRFLRVAGTWGKFLLVWEVESCYRVRLSRSLGKWDARFFVSVT